MADDLGGDRPRRVEGRSGDREGDGEREEFAEAMERSTVVMIPATVVNELMASHAEFSMGVTKLMGLRRRRVEQRLKSLLFRSNRERLVHLLLELAVGDVDVGHCLSPILVARSARGPNDTVRTRYVAD